jgi:two-component system chemotaxis response regulator CheY
LLVRFNSNPKREDQGSRRLERKRRMSGGFEYLKALIVEDNSHMRALLRALLNSVGITDIAEASQGQAAIEALRIRRPDLVLTDLAMKPMDGLQFTRYVRNDQNSPNPFIPIIMITGHTEKHKVEEARDAGVTELLAKPVTAGNLFARIAEIVERPRAFVRCQHYFGPDRRRHRTEGYAGPWRREEDREDMDVR